MGSRITFALYLLVAACGPSTAQEPSATRPPLHPNNAGDQPHRLTITADDPGDGTRRFAVGVAPKVKGEYCEVEQGYLTVKQGDKLVCTCFVQAERFLTGPGFTFTVAAAFLDRSSFSFTVATASPAERKKLPSAAGWVGYQFPLRDFNRPPNQPGPAVEKAPPSRMPDARPKEPASSKVVVEKTSLTFNPKTCTEGQGMFFWGHGSCAVKVLGHTDRHCVFEYTQEIEMGQAVYLVKVPVDSGPVTVKIDSVTKGGSTFDWPVTSFPLDEAKVVRRGEGAGARSDPPKTAAPEQGRKAVERGLDFLQKDAVKWREDRKCSTCHHGTMTVWALSEAISQGYDVDARALADMMQWTKDRFVPRTSVTPGPVASVPLIYLGIMSQNLPVLSRDEINRIGLHLAGRQADDGVWDSPPPKNGPPPTWESRETVALLALLAWEPNQPADAKQPTGARASRAKAEAWLSQTKSTDTTQTLALRLLLDARRGTADKQLQLGIDRLLKRQNVDGGWSQTAEMSSDAYATGQALYALSFADLKNDRPEILRAVSFLAVSQREDGSWPMISRGHPGVEPYTNPVPITYFGTAWATLGLARSVPASRAPAGK